MNILDESGDFVARIPLAAGPHDMAADFLAGQLFVTNAAGGSVTVIDTAANQILATIAGGVAPDGVAVDRIRGRLYVSDRSLGSVTIVDSASRVVVSSVAVGTSPAAPVVDERSGHVFVNNIADATVSTIDGNTGSVVATLPCGQGAMAGAFSPAYRKYYVTNATDATMTVIDVDALRVEATVSLGAAPRAPLVDATGAVVFVPTGDTDAVTVLAASDGRTVGSIRTAFAPTRIATDAAEHLLVVDDALSGATAVKRTNLAPGTAIAAEYYDAEHDQFFHTAEPVELRLIDDGIYGGAWMPTLQFWRVWTGPGKDRVPVCRLYSASATLRSSHVYGDGDECAALQASDAWQYESIAYFVALPDEYGDCADGTEPLYRLQNDVRNSGLNQRFTRDASIRDAMKAAGWVADGTGVDRVFACTPLLDRGAASEPLATPMPKTPPRRGPIPVLPRPG